jgi:cbb3-type cytochrome oxidase maturation protein
MTKIIFGADTGHFLPKGANLLLLHTIKATVTMSIIIILIGASISVAVAFLLAFLWAVKTGQYDDSYTPSVRMLFDDEKPEAPTNPTEIKNKLNT